MLCRLSADSSVWLEYPSCRMGMLTRRSTSCSTPDANSLRPCSTSCGRMRTCSTQLQPMARGCAHCCILLVCTWVMLSSWDTCQAVGSWHGLQVLRKPKEAWPAPSPWASCPCAGAPASSAAARPCACSAASCSAAPVSASPAPNASHNVHGLQDQSGGNMCHWLFACKQEAHATTSNFIIAPFALTHASLLYPQGL